jgi:5'-nucleotidase
VDPGNDDDDDDDDEDDQGASADDLIDFVEQENGTRVEVKQKKIQIGDEVKREEGGRVYRVVCRTPSSTLITDHS